GDLRILPLGKDGCSTALTTLALLCICPAPLHDESLECRARQEDLLGLDDGLGFSDVFALEALAQLLLQVAEVSPQVVDAKRLREVRLVVSREELDHVPEVCDPIVDRR